MRQFFARRPVLAAMLLVLANVALQLGGAVIFATVAPGVPELMQRFVLLLILCGLTAALLFALGYWREAGFVGTAKWRNLWLLWLPALVTLVPFAGGVQLVDAGTLAVLIIGYLGTGFMEEALYRGVILGFLRTCGIASAVAITAVLFGLTHLTRLAFGSAPMTVVWQVLFTMCFSVAYSALRLRTGTIWPLMLLHALGDFTLAIGHQPMWVYPIVHLALLGYGLFLLRRGTLTQAGEQPEVVAAAPAVGAAR